MLLALAGLEAPLQLPLGEQGLYGEDCVFIANDWHAALVPVYLAAKYRSHGVYTNARSVMAIHNLRHQVCVCVAGEGGAERFGCAAQWVGTVSTLGAADSRQQGNASRAVQAVLPVSCVPSAGVHLHCSLPHVFFRLTRPYFGGMHFCRVCSLPPPSTASACPLDGTVSPCCQMLHRTPDIRVGP